jgi:hypothetical protein
MSRPVDGFARLGVSESERLAFQAAGDNFGAIISERLVSCHGDPG